MAQSISLPSVLEERTNLRFAIAGNPNSGKTTLFNSLTGSRYKVANYPGVTVEKREGKVALPDGSQHTIVDLPGTYSLNGTSLDEVIATQALLGDITTVPAPDIVVAVIDASNLERNLYLATQLIDSGIPIIIALNMLDIAEKRGFTIYAELLSRLLDVPVVSLVAREGKGIDRLKEELLKQTVHQHRSSKQFAWLEIDSPFRVASEELGKLEADPQKSSAMATLLG